MGPLPGEIIIWQRPRIRSAPYHRYERFLTCVQGILILRVNLANRYPLIQKASPLVGELSAASCGLRDRTT